MPWQLTTPLNAGDLDTTQAYDQVEIQGLNWDGKRAMMGLPLEWGTTVDGDWKSGITPRGKESFVQIEGQTYLDLLANSMPQAGETTYQAVKRGLYEYLATAGVIGPGSVV